MKIELEVSERLYRILEQCGNPKAILQDWLESGIEARIDTLEIPI